ncbi:dethiobiotin synthase [Arthrobacter mobilis]|uniref:ATP-dependent dethiobiotin synthetase BioD n=1 Tax=Arthrobacter mobilis TaxID=2724944 RepID=A0A7X6HBR9_9MICC|nr:dethiobiotin synthase [Arthrobacter mobilis]NKX54191.1 dethiobiotin synthase [Arthrobacter mobilis]
MTLDLASLPPLLFVTGTDTGVGKTVTTAALAAALSRATRPRAGSRGRVAVYKPTQTGVLGHEPGDVDEVQRLAGTGAVFEGIRLQAPMAPPPAAVLEGAQLPPLAGHIGRISTLARSYGHVLIEGAGGLLVELDAAGHTLADLAAAFPGRAGTVVVCRSGLGTLNHTQLTLEALARRGLPVAGLVIGSWPKDPDEVELSNLEYLRALPVPFLGKIPAGAPALAPEEFAAGARGWLGNFFGSDVDPALSRSTR